MILLGDLADALETRKLVAAHALRPTGARVHPLCPACGAFDTQTPAERPPLLDLKHHIAEALGKTGCAGARPAGNHLRPVATFRI